VDRKALEQRNIAMAHAFHQTGFRHQLRRQLVNSVAILPLPQQRTRKRERILLIRPDHLGDILLTTPAIHFLRAALPNAEIHVLVGGWSAAVIENNADIDLALTLPFPGFSRTLSDHVISPYWLAVQTAQRLRKVGYSMVIILRPDHWWGALVAYLAGIPRRIGYDLPETTPFLTTRTVLRHEHAVLQNARVIALALKRDLPPQAELQLQFNVQQPDRDWVAGFLGECGVPSGQDLIIIHPGSGAAAKLWNSADWAFVADTLAEQYNAMIILTGSDSELPLVQSVAAKMRQEAISLAGETHIGTLAAVYERALLVLGPDNGPIHLACAVHTPTVALFGPADPVEFMPWGDPDRHVVITSDIACRACRILDWRGDPPQYHPCVREIPARAVLEAARRVIQHR
jgi:lipopolysaccharide heptosyltransferase II